METLGTYCELGKGWHCGYSYPQGNRARNRPVHGFPSISPPLPSLLSLFSSSPPSSNLTISIYLSASSLTIFCNYNSSVKFTRLPSVLGPEPMALYTASKCFTTKLSPCLVNSPHFKNSHNCLSYIRFFSGFIPYIPFFLLRCYIFSSELTYFL